MTQSNSEINRRSFIKTAAGATAASMVAFPHISTGNAHAASEKLNLAFVGVGGKGVSSIMPLADLGHNIIGL